ncbi:GNAT family N-acetyltransferase, partial [Streptomyces sp. Act-28]
RPRAGRDRPGGLADGDGRLAGRRLDDRRLALDAERAELTRVFVRHASRGTGGAGLLLAALEAAAVELGARRAVLNTRLDLVEARALYARHGYREIPAYCEEPYAEVWYGKELG